MARTDAYYYNSDGSKVRLEGSDELAVDLNAASAAELPPTVLRRVEEKGSALRDGVVMLGSGELPEDVVRTLDEAGALRPVFGARSTGLLVVLPEVRIETGDEKQAEEVRRYLECSDIGAEVIRDAGERIVVRPTSGRGEDALELANRVEEAVHPLLAQARFLRIVPRP